MTVGKQPHEKISQNGEISFCARRRPVPLYVPVVLVKQYGVQVLSVRPVHIPHVRPDETFQLLDVHAFVNLGLVQVRETCNEHDSRFSFNGLFLRYFSVFLGRIPRKASEAESMEIEEADFYRQNALPVAQRTYFQALKGNGTDMPRVPKIGATVIFMITSANADQYSYIFHC